MTKQLDYSRLARFAICALLMAIALVLLITAVLPYGLFKTTLGLLMPDGNFKSLHTSNVIVFRGWLVVTGFVLTGIAYLFISGKFQLHSWLLHLAGDSKRLWFALRPKREEKLFLGVLLAVVFLGVLSRLAGLWLPLSHDEAYTTVVFAPSVWSAITDYHAPNNHVFHTLLVHFSAEIFGLSSWAVRLPAFIAGVLVISAVYWLGKTIYDKYTGLMAAVLVAFLPVQISYSTNARGYSIVALITLLIFWLGDFVRKDKNVPAWILIVLFSALGLWTVPIMLFPFGILFTWLLVENILAGGSIYGSRLNFLKYWLAAGFGSAGLTLLLYTPIFIFSGFWKVIGVNVPVPWEQMGSTVLAYKSGVYNEWMSGVPFFVVILLNIGFVLALLFHRRLSAQRFPFQLAALIWIFVLVLIERPAAWSRIWFFLMAPMLIWCSAGIAGLLKDIRIKPLKNIPISAILIAILMLFSLTASWRSLASLSEVRQQVGFEETSALFIKDQLQENDLIVAMWPADAALWYYSKLHGIPDRYFDRNRPFDRAFILGIPSEGQTLDFVIEQTKLDKNLLDMGSAQVIQNFGGLEIHLVKHR
jgi:hypothetical protein